ncbi:MAG: hypothetical protein ACRDTJ_18705, partial [Pseudonocardiaceae bacterium]
WPTDPVVVCRDAANLDYAYDKFDLSGYVNPLLASPQVRELVLSACPPGDFDKGGSSSRSRWPAGDLPILIPTILI